MTRANITPNQDIDGIESCWLYVRNLTDTQLRAKLYSVHYNPCVKFQQTPTATVNDDTLSESDEDHIICDSLYFVPETSIDTIEPEVDDLPAIQNPSDRHGRNPKRKAGYPAWQRNFILY